MTRRTFLPCLAAMPTLLRAADDVYTSLFDGKTLNGWSIQAGPESAFYVQDGAIVIHEGANFPTWLRSNKRYENFDFACDFFLKGWSDSGIYLHAPEHGRNTQCGLKVNIFHQADEVTRPESMAAIFPVVAPSKVNVKSKGEWNTLRIVSDWPTLQVWVNGEQVQNVNMETTADLRYRLRSGYVGIESLS